MKRKIKILSSGLLAIAFLFIINCTNTHAATSEYTYLTMVYTYNEDTLTVSLTDNARDHYTINIPSSETWHENNKNNVKKLVISDGIDVISANTFKDYINLEEVVFPKTMGGQIDNYAFYNCPKLKNITIPDGISRIGQYAFYGTGITKAEAPIFLDWIDEHAFNDDTEIIMLKEQEGIIAAGTAGPMRLLGASYGEGIPQNGTCYNKFYYSSYYDDTAFWRLYNDGTLVIWGTDLISGYTASRIPWGCYKDQINTAIFNDDKTGKLTKRNKLNSSELLPGAKYTIYASKPVEEIMNRRIKTISDPQFWDCRNDCISGMRNLETIIINRGVETIEESALNNQGSNSLKDVYISKYVKTIGRDNKQRQFIVIEGPKDDYDEKVHLEISYDDYINNNYEYLGFANDTDFNNQIDFASIPGPNYNCEINGCATIINDVDEYYVSINDTSAPETITYNGKTLYKYETYITKANGSVDVSLPNMDDVEYYVKETGAPEGFQVDPAIYKVDMSGKNIDIQVANYPIENQKPKQADIEKNPDTATSTPAIYFMLFGALSASILLIVRRL